MASTLNETVREDGLRVVTKKLSYSKRIRISISALVGSADDDADKEGQKHFFEHMAFKGTNTKSLDELNVIVGQFLTSNAYTSYLRTTYYAEAAAKRYDLLAGFLFDIYLNSVFPDAEIAKEKEVVFNETVENEENNSRKALQEVKKMLWTQNPMRKFGCGTEKSLAAISRDSLFEDHQKWYIPSNTVVVATGAIEHNDFVKNVFKLMPEFSGSAVRQKWDDESGVLPIVKETIVPRPGRQQGAIVSGCKLPRLSERDDLVFEMLCYMLVSGPEEMLFRELRERRGFVYGAGGGVYGDRELARLFEFGAQMLPHRIDESKDLMHEVVYQYPLDKSHFVRTKNLMLDELAAGAESCGHWDHIILSQMVDGKKDLNYLRNFLQKKQKTIAVIEFEEVEALRKKFLVPERTVCAVVDPR